MRLFVQRRSNNVCAAGEEAVARRQANDIPNPQQRQLWIDGYNVLTTIEAALAGAVIIAGRDGCYRDMASMHGSYRKVEETSPAIELI